jgi:hypothetical protein
MIDHPKTAHGPAPHRPTDRASISPALANDRSTTTAPAVHYDADVAESGGGRFIVTGRGLNLIVIHADPERQFCHELTLRGVPDGPIQFYRSDHGGVASVSFKSIYRAAKHATSLCNEFPRLRVRMSGDERARVKGEPEAVAQGGSSAVRRHPSTREKSRPVGGQWGEDFGGATS